MKYREMLNLNWLEVDKSQIDVYVMLSSKKIQNWLTTFGISYDHNDSYRNILEMFVHSKEFQSMGWECVRDDGVVFINVSYTHASDIEFLDNEVIKIDLKNYKNPSVFLDDPNN